MMDLALDESQTLLVRSFSDFFTKECPPSLVRETEPEGFSRELWQRFAEMGAPGMGLPEDMDGLDCGLLELCLVSAAAGKVLAPLLFAEVAAAGRLLARYSQHAQLVRRLARGEALLSLALPTARVGVSQDILVPGGGVADAVLALEDDILCLYGDADLRRSPTPPNLGSGCPAFWRMGSESAAEPIILAQGVEAKQAFATAWAEWKLLTAAALQGLAQKALAIAVEYASTREQFGVPIGGFQAVSHPLSDCAMAVEGAELLVWEAAWSADQNPGRFQELCAMALIFAAQTAQETTSTSLHTHGGYGFTEEYDIQLYYRRACAWVLQGGGVSEELLSLARLRSNIVANSAAGER
jgi:alkylation response protein AidB-like acyl-CoA dehydrogenase